jgi:hypothetical protein
MLLITCKSVTGELVGVGWAGVELTAVVETAVGTTLGAVVEVGPVTGKAVAVGKLVGAGVFEPAAAGVFVEDAGAAAVLVAWMAVVAVAPGSGVSVAASGYGSQAVTTASSANRTNNEIIILDFMGFSSFLFY